MAGKGKRVRSKVSAIHMITVLLVVSVILNGVLLRAQFSGNTVSTVFDGDSLELSDGTRVRLLGVDAPEKGRCMSHEAAAYLSEKTLGKHVRLKSVMKDDYGRQVAIVIVETVPDWLRYLSWRVCDLVSQSCGSFPDPLVNRAMVREGFAKNMSVDSAYKETIDEASLYAKSNKLGIYSDHCVSAVAKDGCMIKGNIRNGVKSYYTSDCPYYGQVLVDEAYGDQWFCDEYYAKAQGFILASSCTK